MPMGHVDIECQYVENYFKLGFFFLQYIYLKYIHISFKFFLLKSFHSENNLLKKKKIQV